MDWGRRGCESGAAPLVAALLVIACSAAREPTVKPTSTSFDGDVRATFENGAVHVAWSKAEESTSYRVIVAPRVMDELLATGAMPTDDAYGVSVLTTERGASEASTQTVLDDKACCAVRVDALLKDGRAANGLVLHAELVGLEMPPLSEVAAGLEERYPFDESRG